MLVYIKKIKKVFNLFKKPFLISFMFLLFIFPFVYNFYQNYYNLPQQEKNYHQLKSDIQKKIIQKIYYTKKFDIITGEYLYVEAIQKNNNQKYFCKIDSIFYGLLCELIDQQNNKNNISVVKTNINKNYINIYMYLFHILSSFGSIIFIFYILNNMKETSGRLNKNSQISSFQKSLFTFKDIAGNEEEKEEMQELIDFLKNPKKYQDIGASIPKGVLLEGPPGTGKTLLAKAVAGEAGVPFYSVSGSEFVEKYVGVGASRIRNLFKEANINAPCILFIDEIDVLGGKRGGGNSDDPREKDQTLNQLLTEMDGFTTSKGIIIIGATNRADMLDPALLRPGRFDRKFTVGLPDVKARKAILEVHAKNKKLDPSVDLEQIAKQTPGMSGAQLDAVLNEASILTVRNDKETITNEELYEAIDRVLMGPAKKSKKYDEEERKMVAYHKAGHAVIGLKLKHAPKVHKVTIIPRGNAGGYNLMLPEKETFFSSKKRMLANIISFLGGRAAEELMFDDISNGAFGDFQQATQIATQMVTKLGMSDLGPMQNENNYLVNNPLVDNEVKKIIDKSMIEARNIIKENCLLLDAIADSLLAKETITETDLNNIMTNLNPSAEKISINQMQK
ncbi:HflB protease [Candidatus Phytoplasma pruni]|uniref:ATP-dependent zinc metalloprotease FtsH n=1 Tax=Candidatus Phytoplasma pruni TaxID=479893 RepID=A0A0M1N0A5_9MOLU|nr:ATP-dependent zinc metalloprotease FtsH [Candidatus Phytoplasma pruni]KOR75598.1 HflB protease [Candidatus Phytoplasma pruni]